MTAVYDHQRTDTNLRSGAQMQEYREIVARIAREQDGRVLDWGCGLGQVSDLLTKAGVDVTAFDYQPPQEGWHALARFPHITARLTSDPVRLPFADGEFDAVLSCWVLEHVDNHHASLDEVRRVLRPGGTFYVYKLPNRYSYIEFAARRLPVYSHPRLYDVSSTIDLLRAHNFDIVDIRRANMVPIAKVGRFLPSGPLWKANVALERVPGLSVLATNVEVVARRKAA